MNPTLNLLSAAMLLAGVVLAPGAAAATCPDPTQTPLDAVDGCVTFVGDAAQEVVGQAAAVAQDAIATAQAVAQGVADPVFHAVRDIACGAPSTVAEAVGCERPHEPPICYAWVHYANGVFPGGQIGVPPGPGAACFRSSGDAFAHANPLFFCAADLANPNPNAPSPLNQGLYKWDCLVGNGCEPKGVEAFAHLWNGAPGASVRAEVKCDDKTIVSAFVAGPTPGGVAADTGVKTSGDYHCVITMAVKPDTSVNRNGHFDGQAWCRDP